MTPTCPRCNSLMLDEWLDDEDGPWQIRVLKCPCCSYQTDAVTERNRAEKNPDAHHNRGYKRGWAQLL